MPADARPVAGWLFAQVADHHQKHDRLAVGIGGTEHSRRLILRAAGGNTLAGQTEIPRWTWHQLTLVVSGRSVRLLLDGRPEIETQLPAGETAPATAGMACFFAGNSAGTDSFEGRLDEIAVFDRALEEQEIRQLSVAPR